jgi:hypothetical protein
MSADRPGPGARWRRLGEDQALPGEFLVGFAERLLERRQQLLDQGLPPEVARRQAAAEALQAFTAGAGERDWTVNPERLASLAADALGLEEEYRDQHGYEPQLARLSAVGEVLGGEQAREEIPVPRWREPDPPQPPHPDRSHGQPARTPPDSRTASARTQEAGGER